MLLRGTVTLAFTDIEASTCLLRRLGERYGELLAGHRRIIRGTFAASDGIEVDRQGDAFFFVFPSARDAVRAAVEAQREHAGAAWPDDAEVRVRIGLHTGEPTVGAEGYHGMDVVKGARICSLARGGQTLLSQTTHALARAALPADVSVLLAGERQLKDVDDPERIYLLVVDGSQTAGRGAGQLLPARWERGIAERFGTVGTGIVSRIGERIAGSLGPNPAAIAETSPAAWAAVRNDNLEHLVARAVATLDSRFRAGTTAAAGALARPRPEPDE
jgi:class 3 adenylate cyclase